MLSPSNVIIFVLLSEGFRAYKAIASFRPYPVMAMGQGLIAKSNLWAMVLLFLVFGFSNIECDLIMCTYAWF